MKPVYCCNDCWHKFTLTKLIQKQKDKGKPIYCPKCGKEDMFDTGVKR